MRHTAPGAGRRVAAGWLLLAMLVLSVIHGIGGGASIWLAGAAAWTAAMLLWPRIPLKQQAQIVLILILGLVLGAIGEWRGASVSLVQALGQNQTILAMLAAVSFLKLVNRPAASGERVPGGRGAFLRTLAGVHLFGAAINITALVIIADRLAAQSRFGSLQALMLCRGFCLAVMYSPFIGGMAMALALAPGSRLELLALAGIPFSIVGLLLTWWTLERADPVGVAGFRGYPIHFDSLWLPIALAVCVGILHRIYPALSVLTLISLSAPLLTGFALLARDGGRRTMTRLHEHVTATVPEMSGELLLFLSAGVLAAGLTALFASFDGWTPFQRLDGTTASLTLTGIVAISTLGIHPIVCVSFLAPLLAPIDPEPNLLALLFVTGWAIGCTVSPFSGTNLTMQGRYGVNSWAITRDNLGYTAIMLALAWIMLHLFA